MSQFQTRKDNFTKSRVIETSPLNELQINDGEIIVKIDQFAYTANNITYAVAGDMIGYWQFFPPEGEDSNGWGVIPVWGFADVVKSKIAEIPEGDRLFGYFPPSSFLVLKPVGISDRRFVDGMVHRAQLPPVYNSYRRVNAEPGYSKTMDNARMLLFPLHLTAFCLWDLLKEKSWYGAQQIIILSASSKTSIGLAYALHADESTPPVIGFTSQRNVDIVRNLHLYKQSLPYEAIKDIDANIPTVMIDMSGNQSMLKSLYAHLGDNMKYCINVGLTHWDQMGEKDETLAQKSEFFFAPKRIQKRIKDWGAAEFDKRSSSFLINSAQNAAKWLTFQKIDGLSGLNEIHKDVCEGQVAPNKGLIVKL